MGLSALLLAYAAGLGCAPYLSDHRLLPLIPALLAPLWLACRRRRGAAPLLALLFCSLGIAFYHIAATPPRDPGHIRAFIGERPLTVEATVLEVSSRPLERTNIDLQATLVGTEGIFARVRGRIRLHLGAAESGISPGDRIRFSARLRAPRLFGTPGEFDYPRYLASRGIFVVAALESAREIVNFGGGDGGTARLERMRAALARFIDTHLEPTAAPLVKALVIGDKGAITAPQRQLLAHGGISHLFAISGLHLGLIALFLYSAALFLYRRSETLLLGYPPQRALPLPLLPLLFAYLLLTGNALSTRRAFFMAAAGGILLARGRSSTPLRIVAAVAFLILLTEPLALYEPAFQLSFAGVLGILLLLPRWQRRLAAWPGPLRRGGSLLLTTAAATLATSPLVLAHFHLLAPAGLLANAFAVPAIGLLAVPAGLAGALLVPLWPAAALVLLQVCAAIVTAVLRAVAWLISLPLLGGWQLYLGPLPLLGVGLLCAVPFIAGGSRRAWLTRALLAVAATTLLLIPPPPAGLSVTALSVGQGDALLLTTPDGRHYLVDGGGLPGETFDVGERLLAPALGRLGVRTLEAVVLSHDHPDHRNGLLHILEHFSVGAFWSAEKPGDLDPQLTATLRRRQIALRTFPPGWTDLGDAGGAALAIFVPPTPAADRNDRSLLLYAREGGDGVLLTGDLEASGVEKLLRSPPPGPVSLLKLPHHGSRNSSPQMLLEGLQPKLAFVSLGAGNPYRFPHQEVLAELELRSIPLYRTDRMGSLRFLTRGDGWHAEQWQRGLFR